MTDLREKLADVAEVAIDNVHDMDVTLRDYAEAAADVIIAALPDMVMPLVWEKADERHFDKGHCHGYTEEIAYLAPLDWYRIYPASDGKWRWVRQFRMTYIEGNNSKEPEPDSAESAKAAAQAHYVAASLEPFGLTHPLRQGGNEYD